MNCCNYHLGCSHGYSFHSDEPECKCLVKGCKCNHYYGGEYGIKRRIEG